MLPACASYPLPPVHIVFQINRSIPFSKNHGTWTKVFFWDSGKFSWIQWSFSNCYIIGSRHKFTKCLISHQVFIHPETIHSSFMHRFFFWVKFVGAHHKSTTGNILHILPVKHFSLLVEF